MSLSVAYVNKEKVEEDAAVEALANYLMDKWNRKNREKEERLEEQLNKKSLPADNRKA